MLTQAESPHILATCAVSKPLALAGVLHPSGHFGQVAHPDQVRKKAKAWQWTAAHSPGILLFHEFVVQQRTPGVALPVA